MKIYLTLSCIIFCCIVFNLGGKWRVNEIKNDLLENGTAIAAFGDHRYIKITGTWEEVKR